MSYTNPKNIKEALIEASMNNENVDNLIFISDFGTTIIRTIDYDVFKFLIELKILVVGKFKCSLIDKEIYAPGVRVKFTVLDPYWNDDELFVFGSVFGPVQEFVRILI